MGSQKAVPAALLTVREAALRLRVSPVTVHRLYAEGKLLHVRVSNSFRIDCADVKALLQTNRR
ncbi:MAG: helix-turn-helix domain-containing protein [Myxococcaceae bacterium]